MEEEHQTEEFIHEAVSNGVAMDPNVTGLGIGLTGAHRTGKTTIAVKLAEINACPFVQSSSSKIAADMGIDLTRPLTFETRLAFQEEIFRVYDAMYVAQGGRMFVSDRTPMDLAAYLIADIPNDLSDPVLIGRVNEYVAKCYESMNRHFFTVTLVQPGIPYVMEPGKPLPNSAYQEAINTILIGLVFDLRFRRDLYVMHRELTSLDDRLGCITQSCQLAYQQVWHHVRSLPAC